MVVGIMTAPFGQQSVYNQGGKYDDGSDVSKAGNILTFPVSFPSTCISVNATRLCNRTNKAAIIHITGIAKNAVSFEGALNDNDGGTDYRTSGKYTWIAFGY